jgi:hypothetical protein
VTGGIELTNLHADVYGPHYETPMQGPFTEKFVGGRQHRHIEVNRYLSTKEGTNSLDSAEDRGEGFKILLGMCEEDAASSGAIGIVGPQYPDPLSPSVSPPYLYNRPKANRLRDVTAKRPVNIRNILMTTASLKQRMSGVLSHARIGNYQKNYQVVQSAGRTYNDPFFNDQSFDFSLNPEPAYPRGRLPLTGGVANTGSVLDFLLPQRTGSNSNQSIFVNHFAAPGGYEVSSPGYMDPAHEEKSVYNALPYRNLSVLGSGSGVSGSIHAYDQAGENRGLRSLLTLHCGQFGADATYGLHWSSSAGVAPFGNTYVLTGSYQKSNRNTRRRIEYSGSAIASFAAVATSSVYDNGYVTRVIPASDKQYAWITASWVASGSCGAVGGKTGGFLSPFSDYERNLFGYLPRNGIANVYAADGVTITQKDWIPEGYPLLTASDVGCYFNVGVSPPNVTWGPVFSSYIGSPSSVWLDGAAGNGKFAPMDFVTNTMLYDPIMTGSLNKLGYPEPPESDAVCITEYLNSGSDGDPHGYISVSYGRDGGASCDSGMKAGHWTPNSYYKTAGKAGVFNGLILRRNAGAWGWPVFNQIRNCGARQHPLVTFQRQNNYLTLRNAQKNPGTDQGSTQMGDTITSYIEPVVSLSLIHI